MTFVVWDLWKKVDKDMTFRKEIVPVQELPIQELPKSSLSEGIFFVGKEQTKYILERVNSFEQYWNPGVIVEVWSITRDSEHSFRVGPEVVHEIAEIKVLFLRKGDVEIDQIIGNQSVTVGHIFTLKKPKE